MNTYRVYAINTKAPLAPTTTIHYVQGAKYGEAWERARSALTAENKHKGLLFDDGECKVKSTIGAGDHLTVAKIVDMKERNKKVDKKALQAILADPKASAEDKLKALQASLG